MSPVQAALNLLALQLGASALHTLPFGFHSSDATGTQGTGSRVVLVYKKIALVSYGLDLPYVGYKMEQME